MRNREIGCGAKFIFVPLPFVIYIFVGTVGEGFEENEVMFGARAKLLFSRFEKGILNPLSQSIVIQALHPDPKRTPKQKAILIKEKSLPVHANTL